LKLKVVQVKASALQDKPKKAIADKFNIKPLLFAGEAPNIGFAYENKTTV
jgi:hypothetical protein